MRWEKPLEPLPCAFADTVAWARDKAASSPASARRIARTAKSVASSDVIRRVMWIRAPSA